MFRELIPKAYAHVRYLVNDVSETVGQDVEFLISPFFDAANLYLMLGTVLGVVLLWFISRKVPFIRKRLSETSSRSDTYTEFIPWILRLSLGISLIGSGINGTLVSPIITSPGLADLQILVGFLLLAGFLTVPAALITIFLYFAGLKTDWYLFGNLEYLALGLTILIAGHSRPGVDDMLCLPRLKILSFMEKYIPLILRLGVGGAMMFLALYEKILNPHLSEYVVVNFGLLDVVNVSPAMWVLGAGVIEFLIGFALFVGFRTRLVSAIAFIVLTLSFFYFEEDVSSHITLFGILSVLFITKGGFISVDNLLGNKNPKLRTNSSSS